MMAMELAVTIKAEVLNFLDNESGTRTMYAINKYFRLTGPVAQQLLIDQLRKHKYRNTNGREWSRGFTILVAKLRTAGMAMDDLI